MSARKMSLLLGQVHLAPGDNEAPVLPDGTALKPGHTEVNCLERNTGNPDRREEMPPAAPHHDIATKVVAAETSNDREEDDDGDDGARGPSPMARIGGSIAHDQKPRAFDDDVENRSPRLEMAATPQYEEARLRDKGPVRLGNGLTPGQTGPATTETVSVDWPLAEVCDVGLQ
jgi:hypothetical protein